MNTQEFEQILNKPVINWKRFHHHQAWYAVSEDHTVVIFKSYATRIGFISDGIFYYRRKYSMTTTRQMNRFTREFGAVIEEVSNAS